jgi:hypothetical protein
MARPRSRAAKNAESYEIALNSRLARSMSLSTMILTNCRNDILGFQGRLAGLAQSAAHPIKARLVADYRVVVTDRFKHPLRAKAGAVGGVLGCIRETRTYGRAEGLENFMRQPWPIIRRSPVACAKFP